MAVRARMLGTRPSPPGDKRLVNLHIISSPWTPHSSLLDIFFLTNRTDAQISELYSVDHQIQGGPISDSAPARRARARRGKGGALVPFN